MEQLSEVIVKPLERVPDEWQAQLGTLVLLSIAIASLSGLEQSGIVRLVDFVSREVGGIDVGRQPWLEWGPDAPQVLKLDAPEEGVVLDLVRATATETILGIADQAI